MKAPLSWLREMVAVAGSAEEIGATLSVRGFAVESIDHAPLADRTGAVAEDAVLDFEITANRPDCMSIAGLAREIATAYERPFAGAGTAHAPVAAGGSELLKVTIEDAALCPRYVGAVADVRVGPSPPWMQARLQACGIRPISNIVDITNYVLLELGQPMHAFDLARLTGSEIRVRPARTGEVIVTLDGAARELTPDMLVIADAQVPVAVAGVMGGRDSEVTATTRTIVFESAYFHPLSVRRTSRKLGLKTEASMRFERGADPSLPARAMARAFELLAEIGAGAGRGEIVDAYPVPPEAVTLTLRGARLTSFLGLDIPGAEVERILTSLGFLLAPRGMDAGGPVWSVTVPTRRVDIGREVDLIEEIARHHGFDRIPARFPPLTSAPPAIDPRTRRSRQLRAMMVGAGFFEAVTFGFIGESAAAPFASPDQIVPILNPLSENFAVLRPSLIPGLVAAVGHNRRREQRDVRLFEAGARFTVARGERQAIALAWSGAAAAEHWSGGAREVDFFDLKGMVERISSALGVAAGVRTASGDDAPFLTPGRAAVLTNGSDVLGVFGQLQPALAASHGVTDAVFVAELDLDVIDGLRAHGDLRVEALPRFPSVTRDISILVPDTLAAEQVRATIRAAAPPTLVGVREFDRYQGRNIPEGHVSLSLRLTFRAADRTLTDAEVQAAMDGVLAALVTAHGAVQR